MLPPPLSDSRIYCSFQQRLSTKYRTVSIDLPEAKSVDQALELMVALIEKGTKYKFHLFASSATGWLAQYLANRFADRVKSLILINSYYHNTAYGSTYRMALKSTKLLPGFKFRGEVIKQTKMLRYGINNQEAIDKYLNNRVKELDKSGIRTQMAWFLEDRQPPQPLQCPILSIHATDDPLITTDQFEELHTVHHQIEVHSIATRAHLLCLSHPEIVTEQILEFLEKKS